MKKAVTLIELLVAICISTILLAAVTASFYYINDTDRITINESKANYSLSNIKDYIIENADAIMEVQNKFSNNQYFKYDSSKNILYYQDNGSYKQLFDQMPFENLNFTFYHDDVFVKCKISYAVTKKEMELSFVIDNYNFEDVLKYSIFSLDYAIYSKDAIDENFKLSALEISQDDENYYLYDFANKKDYSLGVLTITYIIDSEQNEAKVYYLNTPYSEIIYDKINNKIIYTINDVNYELINNKGENIWQNKRKLTQ